MRKLIAVAMLAALAFSGYVAAPIVTAWNIREAIKSGDAGYLAGKIEWPRVKETLRASLTAVALDLPPAADTAAATAGATATATPTGPKPSLWKRFKAYIGRGAIDRMVETYANADGLPKLFAYRQTYRSATGHVEEPKTLANLPHRIASAWSRVRRAEFLSPDRFEMEMTDKGDPSRSFAGTLELIGMEWKLVSLHVRQEKSNPLTGHPGPAPAVAPEAAPAAAGSLSRLQDAMASRPAEPDLRDPMER